MVPGHMSLEQLCHVEDGHKNLPKMLVKIGKYICNILEIADIEFVVVGGGWWWSKVIPVSNPT